MNAPGAKAPFTYGTKAARNIPKAFRKSYTAILTWPYQKTLRIMKLIMLFMLLGLLQVSAKGKGQTITLSVRKAPVEQVFKSIEQQSGYTFVVFRKDLEKIGRISVQLNSVPLKVALDKCFDGTPFTYTIDEKNIIVKSAPSVSAPDPPIGFDPLPPPPYVGIVKGPDGQPLAFATVSIKGANIATSTNAEGRFMIDAPAGAILVISSVGYQTREIKLGDNFSLSITLAIRSTVIDTAVVNFVSTGYQYIAKERATGAFSHVSTVDLDKQIGALSIQDKFKNLLPGVLVDGGNISVRGKSSINASQAPLIVVDGFASALDMATINPNDVESITVLRDAAAASIWGSRASNGVIVIITKRGRNVNGKPTLSFSSSIRIEDMPNLADLRLANSSQMIDVEIEALRKGWFSLNTSDNNFGYSRAYEIYRKQAKGEITEAEANRLYDVLRNNNSFGQKDLFFRKGVYQQYNLNVAGSTSLNKYYISFNYQQNQPYSKREDQKRFTLFAKNSYQFLSKLRFDADINLSYSRSEDNGVSMYEFGRQRPYELFVDADGNYVPVYQSGQMSRETARTWEQKGYYNWDKNLKQNFDNSDKTSFFFAPRISLGLNYDVFKGFSAETRIQHERYEYRYDNFQNDQLYDTRNTINLYTVVQPGNTLLYNLPRGTIYQVNSQSMQTTTWRNQLRFDREFNGTRHRISAIAGTELNRIASKYKDDRFFNYDREKLTYSLVDEDRLSKGATGYNGQVYNLAPLWRPVRESENRYFSMFFNGSYTFEDKYTVSTSARIDKSNLFGAATNDKMTPLYSIGAAWNISREQFFKVHVIDDLKLRVTTGVNGNVDKSTSKVLVATPMKNSYSTGEDYLKITFPENNNLRWESTRSTNFGFDMVMLKRRLSASFDYYIKKSYDLLGPVESDPSLGFEKVYKNTASVSNIGFDVRLTGEILTGQFRWNSTLNLSFNKNKVTKVYNPAPYIDNYLAGGPAREIEGRPIDYFYSYRWAGLDHNGNPQVYNDKGEVVSDIASAQPNINWLEYSGTTVPLYYGSFINNFSWKGFTLTPIITFQLGHVMRLPTPYLQTTGGMMADIDKRWRKPGDEAFTDLPGLYATNNEPYARRQFYFNGNNKVASASFIRLSNVSLTYDLPRAVTGKIFRGIQLQAQVTDIAVWKKNKQGYDPEAINRRWADLYFAPVPTYTFGLRADL